MKYLDKDGLTYAWSKIKAKIDAKPDLDKIYPVGSIYMTMASLNPGDLFGGTWTKLSGGYLYADTSNAGSKGGSNSFTLTTANLPAHTHSTPNHTHSYTRTDSTMQARITENQMPAHFHDQTVTTSGSNNGRSDYNSDGFGASYTQGSNTGLKGGNAGHNHGLNQSTVSTGASSGTTGSTGSGQAVNIRPTYINVYMWQRTA